VLGLPPTGWLSELAAVRYRENLSFLDPANSPQEVDGAFLVWGKRKDPYISFSHSFEAELP
jgi:hypothetical protein